MQITVSSKYQIVIPKDARKKLQLMPGDKINVDTKGTSISITKAPTVREQLETILYASKPTKSDAVTRIRKLRDEWDT